METIYVYDPESLEVILKIRGNDRSKLEVKVKEMLGDDSELGWSFDYPGIPINK